MCIATHYAILVETLSSFLRVGNKCNLSPLLFQMCLIVNTTVQILNSSRQTFSNKIRRRVWQHLIWLTGNP